MRGPSKSDGSHWDAAALRQEREDGWFREHEVEMIEAAKRRRAESSPPVRREAQGAAVTPRRCPNDGSPMALDRIEEIEVDRCGTCGGMFFDRGELETLLLRHDGQRRGFFRKLLGFENAG